MKNNVLGYRIKTMLQEQNKSQLDLCREIDMRPTTLNSIITGDRENPRIETIVSIARGLNTSLDYLLGITDEPSTNINLQSVSKKYGLTSKSLNNIKETTRDIEGNQFSEHLQRSQAINVLLESPLLEDFLACFSDYLNFYHSLDSYSFISKVEDDNLKNNTLEFKDSDGFLTSQNMVDIVLLESLKNVLIKIKEHSEFYQSNLSNEYHKLMEERNDMIHKFRPSAPRDFYDKHFAEIEEKIELVDWKIKMSKK